VNEILKEPCPTDRRIPSTSVNICPRNSSNPPAINQTEFARRIGWTETHLNELIHSQRDVSAETALDLANALRTSARL